jgi:diacylglycerol kinase (ATP)
LLVTNPYANRWRAQRKLQRVEAACSAANLDYEAVVTDGPGDAINRARNAASRGFGAVIAAGGDGTVSEVVNGLMQAGDGQRASLPLGVIPIGTGNDFAAMAGIPLDIEAAVNAIAAGHTRRLDVGQVNERFFDNNAAIAMEPRVSIASARIRWLWGSSRYVVALLQTLLRLSTWKMRVRWDDGYFEGELLLLSVCNSPRTGGKFVMAPHASMEDGLLDVVLIPQVSLWTVLGILPGLFRGTHLRHRDVMHFRTREITIASEPGTPLHADGEVIGGDLCQLSFTALPQALEVLLPSKAG